jgi:phage terminase large subunit-like protein
VLRAEALRLSPLAFLTHAIRLAGEHTATLVLETNYGDAMMVALLEQAIEHGGRRVAYRTVAATTGKIARAEQAAALYERGLVSHVGALDALEDQQLTFTGMAGEASDIVDALGWALDELERYGVGRPVFDERASAAAAVPWGAHGAGIEGAAIPWEDDVTWMHGQFPPGP